jgi:hypothetical protein
MLVKYNQYNCSKGVVLVYENGYVEFIPYYDDSDDLDFDNNEELVLMDSGVEDMEESIEIKEYFATLGKIE